MFMFRWISPVHKDLAKKGNINRNASKGPFPVIIVGLIAAARIRLKYWKVAESTDL